MFILRATEFGPPLEVLALEETPPPPSPAHGEALVEVLAAPINPMDILMLRGFYPLAPKAPWIPGSEGVARVVEAGPGVALTKNSRVLLPVRCGSWRQQMCLDAAELCPLPSTLAPDDAACLRVNGLSADVLLNDYAQLQAGDWLVQSAGNGSVGRFVIQLAKTRGIRTINLVRDLGCAEELRALGADLVLLEEQAKAKTLREHLGGSRPRVAFDGIGGATTQALAKLLAPGSTIFSYGAMSRRPAELGVDQSVFRDIQLHGFWLYRWTQAQSRDLVHQRLQGLAKLGLQTPISARFRLEDYRQALEHLKHPHRKGRVLLCPTL